MVERDELDDVFAIMRVQFEKLNHNEVVSILINLLAYALITESDTAKEAYRECYNVKDTLKRTITKNWANKDQSRVN